MPAELGLHRVGDIARLQLEGCFLELWHHLAATEIAQRPAVVLGARVLGVLLRHLGEIGPVRDFFRDLFRLIFALHQDVTGLDLLLGLQQLNLLIIEPLGVGFRHRLLDGLVKIGVA